jgi:hypothetical protein
LTLGASREAAIVNRAALWCATRKRLLVICAKSGPARRPSLLPLSKPAAPPAIEIHATQQCARAKRAAAAFAC